MKMKNFTAFCTLMMIGLLVITGCQGLFEPPAKPAADGTGTLYVSINDGRTIVPTARLDKYVLTITDGDSVATPYPITGGGTGVVLATGTYGLKIEGFMVIDDADVLIAESDGSHTVAISDGATESVAIALQPKSGANDDKGYFEWDFSTVITTSVGVKIYDADTDAQVGTDETGATVKVELAIGTYNVEFTVVAGGETYVWREILYIYAGLTSVYGPAQFATSEVLPTIPYVVPADGIGYFYVDLNDWKTVRDSNVYSGPAIKGATAANGLTVTYTNANQAVNLGLTTAQQAILANTAVQSVTVTITGTAAGGNFRCHIGDASAGSNWNATNTYYWGSDGWATFSTLVAPINLDFARRTVNHFILQTQNANAGAVTINSIRIDYHAVNIKSVYAGYVDLDLSKSNKVSEAVNINPVGTSYDAGTGVLTATYDGTNSGTRLNIELPSVLFDSITTGSGLKNVGVTIWGEETSSNNDNFRYHLGNPDLGGDWNVTPATNSNAYGTLSTLVGDGLGKTQILAVSNPTRLFKVEDGNVTDIPNGYLILQQQNANATVIEFSKIRIYYELAKPCTCELSEGEFMCDGIFMPGCTEGECKCTPDVGATGSGVAWEGVEVKAENGLGGKLSTDGALTGVVGLGLKGSGGPKIHLLDDGGLLFYARPNDYSCVDVDTSEVTLVGATSYKVKITGRAMVGVAGQIVQGGDPYGTHAAANATGTAGQLGTFTVETGALTGTALTTVALRIRAAGTNPFILDTVVIQEVDGNGDPVGSALLDIDFSD